MHLEESFLSEYAMPGALVKMRCLMQDYCVPLWFIVLFLRVGGNAVFLSFYSVVDIGSLLLSTTYIWSQLLPCYGIEAFFLFYYFIIMKICSFLPLLWKLHIFSSLLFCFLVKQICHRDLKLENTLLDGSPAPRLKICDFGYSKVLVVFLFLILSAVSLGERERGWGDHLVKVNYWLAILGELRFSWQNIFCRFRWFWLQNVSQTFITLKQQNWDMNLCAHTETR